MNRVQSLHPGIFEYKWNDNGYRYSHGDDGASSASYSELIELSSDKATGRTDINPNINLDCLNNNHHVCQPPAVIFIIVPTDRNDNKSVERSAYNPYIYQISTF